MGDEADYKNRIKSLENKLALNTLKTKLLVDFQRNATDPVPLVITSICMEKVDKIKLLGTWIAEDLFSTSNTIMLVKKAQ